MWILFILVLLVTGGVTVHASEELPLWTVSEPPDAGFRIDLSDDPPSVSIEFPRVAFPLGSSLDATHLNVTPELPCIWSLYGERTIECLLEGPEKLADATRYRFSIAVPSPDGSTQKATFSIDAKTPLLIDRFADEEPNTPRATNSLYLQSLIDFDPTVLSQFITTDDPEIKPHVEKQKSSTTGRYEWKATFEGMTPGRTYTISLREGLPANNDSLVGRSKVLNQIRLPEFSIGTIECSQEDHAVSLQVDGDRLACLANEPVRMFLRTNNLAPSIANERLIRSLESKLQTSAELIQSAGGDAPLETGVILAFESPEAVGVHDIDLTSLTNASGEVLQGQTRFVLELLPHPPGVAPAYGHWWSYPESPALFPLGTSIEPWVNAVNAQSQSVQIELWDGKNVQKRHFTIAQRAPHKSERIKLPANEWLPSGGVFNTKIDQRQSFYIQKTDIDLLAVHTPGQVTIHVMDLFTRQPKAGAVVELIELSESVRSHDALSALHSAPVLASGVSDAEGVVHLPVTKINYREYNMPSIRVRTKTSFAWMPQAPYVSNSASSGNSLYNTEWRSQFHWITHKPFYSPGDEVHFRIWHRQRVDRVLQLPATRLKGPATLLFGRDTLLKTGLNWDKNQGISGSFTLPNRVPPGQFHITLQSSDIGAEVSLPLQIAQFTSRSATTETHTKSGELQPAESPVMRGQVIAASGEALDGITVHVESSTTPLRVNERFSRWSKFNFGDATADSTDEERAHRSVQEGQTGPDGAFVIEVAESPSPPPTRFVRIRAQPVARLDSGVRAPGKSVTWRKSLSPYHLGVHQRRHESTFIPYLEVVAIDDRGELIQQGAWTIEALNQVGTVVGTCSQAANRNIQRCEFGERLATHIKSYRASLRINGQEVHTFRLTSEDQYQAEEWGLSNRIDLRLAEHSPSTLPDEGSPLVLGFESPFEDAKAIVWAHRNVLLSRQEFDVHAGLNNVSLPINGELTHGFDVVVLVLPNNLKALIPENRLAAATGIKHAAYASGRLTFRPREKKEDTRRFRFMPVTKKASPRQNVDLSVVGPAGTAYTFVVVDAQLPAALEKPLQYSEPFRRDTDYRGFAVNLLSADIPLASAEDVFHPFSFDIGTMEVESAFPASLDVRAYRPAPPQTAGVEFSQREASNHDWLAQIQRNCGCDPRVLMQSAAAFAPAVPANEDGIASLRFTTPDNLTTWRVFAIAEYNDGHLETQSMDIESTLPISLSIDAPPNATPGDNVDARFSAIAEPANAETIAKRASITGKLICTSANDCPSPKKVEVTLNKGGRGSAHLLVPTGTASLALLAESKFRDQQDAVVTPLGLRPVLKVSTLTRTDLVTSQQRFTLNSPQGLNPRIVFSPVRSLVGDLSALFSYTRDYPWTCWEQQVSRAVVAASHTKLSLVANGESLPHSDLLDTMWHKTRAHQNYDGGFSFVEEQSSDPVLSAWTGLAWGWIESETEQRRASERRELDRYLWNQLHDDDLKPDDSLWLLAGIQPGESSRQWLEKNLPAEDPVEPLKKVLLHMALGHHGLQSNRMVRLRSDLLERIRSSGASAEWRPGSSGIVSDIGVRCAAALVLLEDQDADTELIGKLIGASRNERGFGDTQANAWCAMAAAKYLDRVPPDLHARLPIIALDGNRLSPDASGHTTASIAQPTLEVELTPNSPNPALVSTRLITDLDRRELTASNHGIGLVRVYEVLRDGAWIPVTLETPVKNGDFVRVTLNVINPVERQHVGLSDVIPAGFVPVDLSLEGSTTDTMRTALRMGHIPFHATTIEADEGKFHALSLPAGTHLVRHVIEARWRGDYQALPAEVEVMYQPDIKGNTASQRLPVAEP